MTAPVAREAMIREIQALHNDADRKLSAWYQITLEGNFLVASTDPADREEKLLNGFLQESKKAEAQYLAAADRFGKKVLEYVSTQGRIGFLACALSDSPLNGALFVQHVLRTRAAIQQSQQRAIG